MMLKVNESMIEMNELQAKSVRRADFPRTPAAGKIRYKTIKILQFCQEFRVSDIINLESRKSCLCRKAGFVIGSAETRRRRGIKKIETSYLIRGATCEKAGLKVTNGEKNNWFRSRAVAGCV